MHMVQHRYTLALCDHLQCWLSTHKAISSLWQRPGQTFDQTRFALRAPRVNQLGIVDFELVNYLAVVNQESEAEGAFNMLMSNQLICRCAVCPEGQTAMQTGQEHTEAGLNLGGPLEEPLLR